MTNYLLLTNDKFIKPGTYTLKLDVKKGKKEIHCVLQGVKVIREKTLKIRKPMSEQGRKNISKAKKAYFKRMKANGTS